MTAEKHIGDSAPNFKPIDYNGLTWKQAHLLKFLADAEEAGRTTPSFDEMMVHMNLNSKSGIHRMLVALEERGRIVRLKHRARAIRVLRGDPLTLSGALKAVIDSCGISGETRRELSRLLSAINA